MTFRDLREFIEAVEKLGEVKVIRGADWNLELGCIAELMAEQGGPLLVFDEIKGYARGFRVVANFMASRRRMALAFNLPLGASNIELIDRWRQRLRDFTPVQPLEVADGPIQENVVSGHNVDLEIFPAPKWHDLDGGRYIGTGDMVITRDPDSGWVNVGTYRGCVQGRDRLSLWIINRKHGRIIAEKYWEQGRSCPVAVVLGCEPITWYAAQSARPYGATEYAFAGYLRGAPVEVIRGERTGLPIPAHAEIVLEGEIPPLAEESAPEGPFGEWPGYYTHAGRECVVRVQRIMFRNDPIILGVPPLLPTTMRFGLPRTAATIWDHLERSGITDVSGVWCHCESLFIVVALRQRYAGHAKQALLVASSLFTGSSMSRYFVTVDDDIDPSDLQRVLWAMCTRVDGSESLETLHHTWTSDLDPRVSPERKARGDHTIGKVLIDACRPFHWKDQFPLPNVFSGEMRAAVWNKWGKELG